MSIGQQLRVAVRQWTRQPRLTATVVLTLALGIGGAATMYGFLQAMARHGQPTVPRPEEVGRLFAALPQQADGRGAVSLDDYRRWGETVRSLETLAAYRGETRVLRTAEGGDEVEVLSVTPSYLALLGMPPARGRYFAPEESRAADGRLAVLSERAWRGRFGADAGVLGRTLDLDGRAYTVVGVVAERLGLVMPTTEVFLPLVETEGGAVRVIARRRAHVSWDEVRAEMATVGFGSTSLQLRVNVVPILDDARFRTRMGWLMFVGPALLVLLIGCGNVASLLLVRAVEREREMATRLALGASRRQLAAQLLVEGSTLAVVGGALGAAIATAGLRVLQSSYPAAAGVHMGMDAGVMAFAGMATLLTPLVFGAAPLLHSLRLDLSGALRAGLRQPLFGIRQYHMRDVLAVLEVSLSVGLLMFFSMVLSLLKATHEVDLNFASEGLVFAQMPRSEGRAAPGLPRRLREQLGAVPGVTQVTVGELPFGHGGVRVSRSPSGPAVVSREVRVDGDYFATLRLPIIRGRGIEDRDVQGTAATAVVSEGLEARLWPQEDSLGQVLHVSGDGKTESVTIVGVSRDALSMGRLRHAEAPRFESFRYALYRPWSQGSRSISSLVVRVQGGGMSLFAPLAQAVRVADPGLQLRRVVDVRSALDLGGNQGEARVIQTILVGFGGLALLLAVIGVFGVMRQLVDERQAEFGVRLALGASPHHLVRLVVEEGLIRVGLGSGIAVAFVSLCARFGFSGLLTLSASDPWLWLAVLSAVAVTAAAACYLPARRAARVDPMVTLRCE